MSIALKPLGPLEPLSAKSPWAIIPRKRLEIDYSDIAYAMKESIVSSDSERAELQREIEDVWSPGDSIVTLSVRTSFDLILQALRLPRGSEVVLSGVTIKDMVKIIEHHGLVAVPVDLTPDTLVVDMDIMKKAFTKNTKLVLIAHIFGVLNDMGPVCDLAHEHGALVLEDCAEYYVGPSYKGHDKVDFSVFSFGTIKTSTALGGCMLRVKDAQTRRVIRAINGTVDARPRSVFFKRLVRYMFVHGISTPSAYGILVRLLSIGGVSHDELITSAIRGFPGDDLISLIRFRPSIPLLRLLQRRLTNFDEVYVSARIQRCTYAAALLRDFPGTFVPGHKCPKHSYWLFPVMVDYPPIVCAEMLRYGYDVTQGTTQLGPVSKYTTLSNGHSLSLLTPFADKMMKSVVYLPITAEMSKTDVEAIIKAFKVVVERSTATGGGAPAPRL